MDGRSLARRIGEILAWITIIGVSVYSVVTLVGIFQGIGTTPHAPNALTPVNAPTDLSPDALTMTAVVTDSTTIQIIIPTTAPNLPSNPAAPARATAAAASGSVDGTPVTETPYIVPVPTENITQTITMVAETPTDTTIETVTGTPPTATMTSTVGSVTATASPTAAVVATATGAATATNVATATRTAAATKTSTPVPATATDTPEPPTETDEPTATDIPVDTPTP